MKKSPLLPLIIAGPTASKKSKLAMYLAERHRGEIICADSRQFYAGMSIGTAAPNSNDLKRVVHHGYGTIDPAHTKIDAGFFVRFAEDVIKEVQSRNKRPILVGGTGLYLRALRFGFINIPSSNRHITEEIERRGEKIGLDGLYEELKRIDQQSADTIKPTDRYRIVRALEIYAITKQKPSVLRQSFSLEEPRLMAHWRYQCPDREQLIKNIEARVEIMFERGLIEEAIALRNRLHPEHWALQIMGYQEALMFVDTKIDLAEAKMRTVIRHRQYAKRQFTWFNKEQFYRRINQDIP